MPRMSRAPQIWMEAEEASTSVLPPASPRGTARPDRWSVEAGMPPLPCGMTDRHVSALCGHAVSRNDMPELKPFNLRYRRRKHRYVIDLQVGVCSWLFSACQCYASGPRRVYKAGDQKILYSMTLWPVRSWSLEGVLHLLPSYIRFAVFTVWTWKL